MSNRKHSSEARIVTYVRDYFESSGYFTGRELDFGHGRADLVAFRVDPERVHRRLENGQFRSLSRVEHYSIIRLLPEMETGSSLSLDMISEYFPLRKRYIKEELLSFLIRTGYVVEIDPGHYAKVNGFVPLADEITAVEAKISDWKKGAIQAKRYQLFANRTFLALGSRFIHRVDHRLLQNHKIGLISVEGSAVEVVFEAPSMSPRDNDRFSFAPEWLWRHRRADLKRGIPHASSKQIP